MPDNITEKQKDTLSILAKQLEKEKYTVTALSELHRNEENIIVGKQKIGSPSVLNHFLSKNQSTNQNNKQKSCILNVRLLFYDSILVIYRIFK